MSSLVIDEPLYPDPGRYRVTSGELHKVAGFNVRRIELLKQLDEFISLVNLVVPICAMWVAGSFLTKKDAPGDIDVVLLVDEDRINGLTDLGARNLVTPSGLRALADRRGLDLDVYLLGWRARPSTGPEGPEDEAYLLYRGYWDDFWGRQRSVPKGHAPTRVCALPRRGYVEVIVNDYS
jgi:hypothetical protein